MYMIASSIPLFAPIFPLAMHNTAIGKTAVAGCTKTTRTRSITTVTIKAGRLMVENTCEDAWMPSGDPGREDIPILTA
jgi:hypothetical protein